MTTAPNPEMGSMTIAQKALMAVVVLLLGVGAVIGLTSFFVPVGTALRLWTAALLLFVLWAALRPVSTRGLAPSPEPAADADSAEAGFARLAALDDAAVAEVSRSRLWSHGERRARAYVLMHGVSNSPASFVDLGPALHAAGHNVLAPRMPGNGMADTALPTLGDMTAEGLVQWVDRAIDIAAGLGEEVHVVGISGGGVTAGWALAARPEVRLALLIAPSHGLASFGPGTNDFLMRLMLSLPDLSIWKDPVKRAAAPGRAHTMKRQRTRGFGEVMRLGLATRRLLAGAPAPWPGGALALLTNAADTAVSAASAHQVADAFAVAGAPVVRREIPAACALGHEIIDPTEPGNDPARTHPALFAYLVDGVVPSSLEIRDRPSPATSAMVA